MSSVPRADAPRATCHPFPRAAPQFALHPVMKHSAVRATCTVPRVPCADASHPHPPVCCSLTGRGPQEPAAARPGGCGPGQQRGLREPRHAARCQPHRPVPTPTPAGAAAWWCSPHGGPGIQRRWQRWRCGRLLLPHPATPTRSPPSRRQPLTLCRRLQPLPSPDRLHLHGPPASTPHPLPRPANGPPRPTLPPSRPCHQPPPLPLPARTRPCRRTLLPRPRHLRTLA